MKKRYEEIMDQIEVSEEMRARIADRIFAYDFERKSSSGVMRFPSMLKYLSIAACFVVLMAGAFYASRLSHVRQPEDQLVFQTGSSIVEVSSAEELSTAVGFEIEDMSQLPFEPVERIYTAYWDELAEIIYTGSGQTATFRKSYAAEDISGDFNSYSAVKEISVDSLYVTLKGTAGAYTLAVWSDEDYSYSLRLSKGLTEAEWQSVIKAMD